MMGAIMGDIVGSRFEFNNHKSKDFSLFTPDCQVTDDSIMSLSLAKALMETEKRLEARQGGFDQDYYSLLEKMALRYMQEIGRKYPHCGYGGRFARWIFSDNPRPYNSYGNGAAMRISPIGFFAKSEEEVFALSKAVTKVSHNHKEGLKGAEATALAIFMARQGSSKGQIRDRINRDYYPLDFTLDQIRDTYSFNETCQATVPQALQAFIESTSFEDAIRTAISLGGDSDTLAAITGSIAQAYYGLPLALEQEALSYLDKQLLEIYLDWTDFLTRV